VERYQLDRAGLTSTHSTGSGTKLLEKVGLSSFLELPRVRRRAGVGILTSPRLSAAVLEFAPENERVASLRLRVAGSKALTGLCICTKRSSPFVVGGPGKGIACRLHSSTGTLPRSRGQ